MARWVVMVVPGSRQNAVISSGRQALKDAGDRVAEIEQHWRGVLTEQRFDDMCATMQNLLNVLQRQAGEPDA